MTKKSEQYGQRIIQIDSRIAELQKQKRLLETKRKEALAGASALFPWPG